MEVEALVRKLHDTPHRFVLAATGGGSVAFSRLLTVPGASRTVLEATVPYASAALVEWLNAVPESFCAPRTARGMAMAGYRRAQRLAEAEELPAESPILGVGCTCSLASDRPKRGEHRAHLAIQADGYTQTESLELAKDRRTRLQEEELVARWMLNLLAEASGLTERLELPLLAGERIERERVEAPPAWRELMAGRVSAVWHRGAESGPWTDRPTAALFPGAFNPRHTGHAIMQGAAAHRLGAAVDFEISVINVDKPPLDYSDLATRLASFPPQDRVWLSRAPTFVEKSRLFAGATFVVGADTITRIGQPRYYGDDPVARDRAIAEIAGQDCRFLVFGRQSPRGFETLESLEVPPNLRALCTGVPESEFRQDISSTELRRQQGDAS